MKTGFEAISLKQIRTISEILSKSTLDQKDFVRKKYLENAANFDETIEFLSKIKLIQLDKNTIEPTAVYRKFLQCFKDSKKSGQDMSGFIVNRIFNTQNYYSPYIGQFLANFIYADGQYEFTPLTADRLKYSYLRNFLIELGLLQLDAQENKYIIESELLISFSQRRKYRHISLEEFNKIQQFRADIGFKAELKIIEYEKKRLVQYPKLVEQIEHTSQTDIAAGYDVKSFDYSQDINSTPRFIEVKAVSPWDFRFYWTKNEIEASRLYKRNYYLYLLPTQTKNEFEIKKLRIICDPYKNVYQNKNEWIRAIESISFSLQNSEVNV